jgi:AAA+ ATPase superfamily predicted ATPase
LQEPPFIVGKPATGEYFVNREKELHRLLLLAEGLEKKSSSNSILIGLRRTGKTSILQNLIVNLEPNRRIIPLMISCYGMTSKSRFAKLVVDQALANYVNKTGDNAYKARILNVLGQKAKAAKEMVSEVRFSEFSLKVRDSKTDEDDLIEDSLGFVESLAEEKNSYFLIILDEFQDLIKWGDDSLKRMRTVIQNQKRTCYVLSGSATTIMHDLVYESRSPFYRQLVDIPVGKLPNDVVRNFVKERFRSAQVKIGDEELNKIVTYCDGYPDYVQRLGLELYLSAGPNGSITESIVDQAYENIVLTLDGEFENYFATFSPLDKELLIAIASSKIRASEIAREVRKPLANISKNLTLLLNYGVVERPLPGQYRMTDPVFNDWLRRRYSPLE